MVPCRPTYTDCLLRDLNSLVSKPPGGLRGGTKNFCISNNKSIDGLRGGYKTNKRFICSNNNNSNTLKSNNNDDLCPNDNNNDILMSGPTTIIMIWGKTTIIMIHAPTIMIIIWDVTAIIMIQVPTTIIMIHYYIVLSAIYNSKRSYNNKCNASKEVLIQMKIWRRNNKGWILNSKESRNISTKIWRRLLIMVVLSITYGIF